VGKKEKGPWDTGGAKNRLEKRENLFNKGGGFSPLMGRIGAEKGGKKPAKRSGEKRVLLLGRKKRGGKKKRRGGSIARGEKKLGVGKFGRLGGVLKEVKRRGFWEKTNPWPGEVIWFKRKEGIGGKILGRSKNGTERQFGDI